MACKHVNRMRTDIFAVLSFGSILKARTQALYLRLLIADAYVFAEGQALL